MGSSFHGGLTGKPGSGLMPGAYVWKKVLGRVSLHIGASLWDLGRLGSVYRKLLEMVEGGSTNGASLYE